MTAGLSAARLRAGRHSSTSGRYERPVVETSALQPLMQRHQPRYLYGGPSRRVNVSHQAPQSLQRYLGCS